VRQTDVIVDMRVLRKIFDFRENPKIWYQQFNDLRTPNSPKSNFATEPRERLRRGAEGWLLRYNGWRAFGHNQ